MTFVELLNKNVVQLAAILAVIFFVGIRIGFARGGWGRHLPYIWTLIVYIIYVLISPFFFYSNNKTVIIGTDISNYYGLGFFFNSVAVLSFIIGYWIKGSNTNKKWNSPATREIENPVFVINIMFYVCYGIVLVNLALGGANIGQVFMGDAILGMGAGGASYYLQNFTDSLICIIILAYLYDVPWKRLIFWILASFFLFSLLGFRYRIMLTLFGILFVFLYKSKIDAKKIVIGIGLAVIFFYGVMFSTVNRHRLILRSYDDLLYNPFEFNYELFFYQTRGALPDMAVYKLYDSPYKEAKHDYGLTMFGYVFIRMIPRTIMPDKDKFYPPPQLVTTVKAYDAWWASKSGEATLSVSAFYMAFGWLGIIFGHFFWGLLLRRFGDTIRFSDRLALAAYIIIPLLTFQWISRGYLPQIVDQAVYMLVPIWVLRYISKRKVEHASH
ncbi:O-antigen polymerase [Longitalea luteola]|uniref:O-antigen polymerase n=1 Tax=Longitalea luteola TaxID=2812563 RepID=UPI001A969058|nr:O-antigen polymerase [Longitalea luteola]